MLFQKNIFYIFMTCLLFQVPTHGQELQPAQDCRECHITFFNEWRESAHAYSSEWTNPLYKGMLEWAENSGGEELSITCRSCHEPARSFREKLEIPLTVIQEGVGCDFCHSVYLEENSNFKFAIRKDGVKLGPIKDALAGAHGCEFSKNQSRSEFCLGCHSSHPDSSPSVQVCNSREEWQEYIKQNTRIECQDCHMPSQEGRAASLGKIRENIHFHKFLGGYSEKMLRTAVSMQMTAKKEQDVTRVEIMTTNRGAGHDVPTGSVMRYLVLEVLAKNNNDNIIWRNFYTSPLKEDPAAVFMRLLEDKQGKAPVPPWEAVAERFDQRLKPGETRKLVYASL